MKKNRKKRTGLGVSLTVLITFAILIPGKVMAQASIFSYLEQALTKIITQSTIVNLANYDYVSGNCLFGVYLAKGSSHSLNMHFDKDVTYLVLAAGDDDIIDMDLALLSSAGTLLQKDTENDATPLLHFTPNYSGNMTLKISNYNSARAGFCVMVVLRQSSSGNFSMYEIAQALDNVIKNAQITYLFSSRFARGTFCLFGGRLSKGADTYLYNTQPPPGEYAMVGAGSNNLSDVDLFIVKQRQRDYISGTEIAKDTATDNHPLCTFTVYRDRYYLLKHKNYSSRGDSPGFVFSILLEL
ncbi:MAG: hypothetical protein ACE5IY_01300 [bacterium]